MPTSDICAKPIEINNQEFTSSLTINAMTTASKFNLVDEAWIPVQGRGWVSLRDIFSDASLTKLGGNPIQKIALFKLLCAIAQAAWTPEDENEWLSSTVVDFQQKCLTYLDRWHDRFWLYGDSPFLQMPDAEKAQVASFAALNLEKASGNTTVLTRMQLQPVLSEAEKALLLVTLMAFAAGGKKVDNSVVLSADYKGKSKSGKYGPALGIKGTLHSFVLTDSIVSSLWLNLFSAELIRKMNCFPAGIGTPPWEKMPEGEDCVTARGLKDSLMGRLVPMCRFCLLTEEGMHYTEGIAHGSYKDGHFDPTQAVCRVKNDFKIVWADPDKRPWRSLTALLSFLDTQDASRYVCSQVELGMSRAREHFDEVTLWAGGVRVTSNAGEQYLTGSDDFIESSFDFQPDAVGQIFFSNFCRLVNLLAKFETILYASIMGYYKELCCDGKTFAAKGTAKFWEIAGLHAQELIDASVPGRDSHPLEVFFLDILKNVYNQSCLHATPRQLQAWAKNQPHASLK